MTARLYGWSVKRAGAGLTIKGYGDDGRQSRVTNVVKIELDRDRSGDAAVYAVTQDGETIELSLRPAPKPQRDAARFLQDAATVLAIAIVAPATATALGFFAFYVGG